MRLSAGAKARQARVRVRRLRGGPAVLDWPTVFSQRLSLPYWERRAERERRTRLWRKRAAASIGALRNDGDAAWSLAARVAAGVALSAVIVSLLELVSRVIGPAVLHQPGVWMRMPPQSLVPLVSASAGVGGVLLALHFSTVGLVASQSYSGVPGELRALFLRERHSTWYVRLLAYTVAASVLLLGADAIGVSVHRTTAIAVAIATAAAVVLLLQLGARLFLFFDLTALARPLPARWRRAMNIPVAHNIQTASAAPATALSSQARDRLLDGRSVADGDAERDGRAHEDVASILTTYRHLAAALVGAAGFDLRPLRRLGSAILERWIEYANIATAIPTRSRFLGRRYEHANVLVADETRRGMAAQTRTAIQPVLGADPLWIERELTDTLDVLLDRLLADPDWTQALALLEQVRGLMAGLARAGRIDDALLLWERVSHRVATALGSEPEQQVRSRTASERATYRLAVANDTAVALTQMWLGLVMWVEAQTPAYWSTTVSRTLPVLNTSIDTTSQPGTGASLRRRAEAKLVVGFDFLRRRGRRAASTTDASFYAARLPRQFVELFEQLHTRLEAQWFAEGGPVTPAWWVSDWVGRQVSRRIGEDVERLLSVVVEFYTRDVRSWHASSRDLGLQMALDGLEALHKMRFHLPGLKEAIIGLEAGLTHTAVSDPWPPGLDPAALDERVEAAERELEDLLAELLRDAAPTRFDATLPDIFGTALDRAFHATFEAVLVGDDERVQRLFPAVFIASIRAHNRLLVDTARRSERDRILLTTEPLLDLLALSGYARAFDRLHDQGSWSTVTATWDRHLDANETSARLVPLLFAATQLHDGIFALTNGSVRRSGLEQAVGARLTELGIVDELSDLWLDDDDQQESTGDPVVAAIARRGLLGVDGIAVFFAEYLRHRAEAVGLEVPRPAQDLVDHIARHSADAREPEEPDEPPA